MKRMFVGAMILILLFGGVMMAQTSDGDQVGSGEVKTTITIQGGADFRITPPDGEIHLDVNPFSDSMSNTVNWRILANLEVTAEFRSIGPNQGDEVPDWARSFFIYQVTDLTGTDDVNYDLGLMSTDVVKITGGGFSEDNGSTQAIPITGKVLLRYFAPDWDPDGLVSGGSFMDLGGPGKEYADLVEVTIKAGVGY